jgi:hypothetical protein
MRGFWEQARITACCGHHPQSENEERKRDPSEPRETALRTLPTDPSVRPGAGSVAQSLALRHRQKCIRPLASGCWWCAPTSDHCAGGGGGYPCCCGGCCSYSCGWYRASRGCERGGAPLVGCCRGGGRASCGARSLCGSGWAGIMPLSCCAIGTLSYMKICPRRRLSAASERITTKSQQQIALPPMSATSSNGTSDWVGSAVKHTACRE